MRFSHKTQIVSLVFAYLAVATLVCIYRFTQPFTSEALTQFDIFYWMGQSRDIQLTGLVPVHNIWIFPSFNAFLSTIGHVDLFSVYLFGGAVVTTLAAIPLAGIVWVLTKDHRATLVTLLLYAAMQRILARSVMYLPEAMTYLFGLTLLYLYVQLFRTRQWVRLIPIWLITAGFVVLHQSGLNFLAFSAVVTVVFAFFFSGVSVKWRYIFGGIATALLALSVLIIKPVRVGLTFFLMKSNGTDKLAFQGDVIPFKQVVSAFDSFYIVLLILSVVMISIYIFRKNPVWLKVSLGLLLLVALFYFSFLYILPSLNLYRLTPWRFYTWFSLFTIPIVGFGLGAILQRVRLSNALLIVALSSIIFLQVNTSLISDTMFTANRDTIQEMQKLVFPDQSIIFTTNANYFQAKYALALSSTNVQEIGADFFRFPTSKIAWDLVKTLPKNNEDAFILISKYQLRQRPSSIDYWRNSAVYDMNLNLFSDKKYFSKYFENANLVVFQAKNTVES